MLTDDPANRFVIYEYKNKSSLRPCAPRTSYIIRISPHIMPDEKAFEASEIRKMADLKSQFTNWTVLQVDENKARLKLMC